MKDDKYWWDRPWSLVDGCTPCSPGCEHCWAAGMTWRFNQEPGLINVKGKHWFFSGKVIIHPDRLSIPLKRRKPTVYAVWNDLFHEAVPDLFRDNAYGIMIMQRRHTYLILSKRPAEMVRYLRTCEEWDFNDFLNIYHGLTICNQQEADEKIPIFLQVPGKKFLSIEPMLGRIVPQLVSRPWCEECNGTGFYGDNGPGIRGNNEYGACDCARKRRIDAVILGGETGPGARPMHPDWVRSVRDQCAAAGMPFFLKSNGEFLHESQFGQHVPSLRLLSRKTKYNQWPDGTRSYKIGKERADRIFDGRTHNDLPWRGNDPEI